MACSGTLQHHNKNDAKLLTKILSCFCVMPNNKGNVKDQVLDKIYTRIKIKHTSKKDNECYIWFLNQTNNRLGKTILE